MTLQSPTATLIPLFSRSEVTDCGYPGLLDQKNHLDVVPGGSRTLHFLRARGAPYPLEQALRYHSLMPLKYSIVFATPVNCCQNRLKGVKAALCHCSGCGIDLIAKVTNQMSLIGVLYTDTIVFATPVNCCQNRLKGVKAALCHCSGCGIDLIAKVTNHMSLIGVLYTDTRLYS